MTIPVHYPMGAQTPKPELLEKLWLDPLYVVERKYDGARYRMFKEDGKVRFLSRQEQKVNGKGIGTPVDKTGNVPHLVEWFSWIPDGTVLDGEIITHELCTSREVTRIMGCQPEKAIARQLEEGYVTFMIYDMPFYAGHNITGKEWIVRRKAMEKLLNSHTGLASSKVKLSHVAFDFKEETYMTIVEEGGEGVILKNVHSFYEASLDPKKIHKPKDTWYKVKKYDTYDCVIMGYTEPTKEYKGKDVETWSYWEKPDGELFFRQNENVETLINFGFQPVTRAYYNGWIGAIRFGQYNKDGELVEIGQTSGINDSTKHEINLAKEDFIGVVIEVGAMRQEPDSFALTHPRFLHFRDDKAPELCLLGEK
jgi:hypothetical protein